MSTDETSTKLNQTGEGGGNGGSGLVLNSPGSTSPTTTTTTTTSTSKPTINLTTLDKIKRFFFSKEEWEAYLMEKLEEQEKKKGGEITLETKSDSTTKKNVVSWLKTVFPSQEDANSFLKLQIDKMQEGQQSASTSTPTSPHPITTTFNNNLSPSSTVSVTSPKETGKASSPPPTTLRTDKKPS